jgi:nucleoside-diphosphate-sugar epimerase
MDKFSIIGGSGFVGTNLCEKLNTYNKSFEIIDIVKNDKYADNTKYADVRNIDTLMKSVNGNIIINLAAEHRDDVRPISLYDQVNVDGAKNICAVAEQKGINKIIFTSSVAIYGLSNEVKDESSPIKPFNDYGRTKWEAEKIFTKWQQKKPADRTLVIIRPTVIFGKNNRGNVYNLFKQINSGFFIPIGKCNNIKSLAYVKNVASFIHHESSRKSGLYIYNYADKPDLKLIDIIQLVSKALDKNFNPNIKLPYTIGLLIGYIADFFSFIFRISLPISAVRVRKFVANTAFTSKSIIDFKDTEDVKDALNETAKFEFKK